MEIRQLQQFLAVAEAGSVSAAARDLHMAQSPLSRAIRSLERELGTELFDRSTRGVVLTAAGHVLQEEAQAVLRRLAEATARVRGHGPEPPPVVMASVVDLPAGWLKATGARLGQTVPPLRLELREGTSSTNPLAVLRGTVDLALTREAARVEGCQHRQLMAEPFGVVLPADHPVAGRPGAISGEALAPLGRWLSFPRPHAPGWFDEIAAYVGATGLGIDRSAESDARDVKLDRVALGHGVTFAPAWQARSLRRHGLVWRPLEDRPLVRRTFVVRSSTGGTRDADLHRVVDCLAATVATALRPVRVQLQR